MLPPLVMVVDADPAVRRTVARMFRMESWDAVEAAPTVDAMMKLDEMGDRDPDLLVCDVTTREDHGLAFAMALTSRLRARPVKVVFHFASLPEPPVRAVAEAAGTILMKPQSLVELGACARRGSGA